MTSSALAPVSGLVSPPPRGRLICEDRPLSEPRTDYVARTALGALIKTFESADQALRWAEEDGRRFPGWQIVREVEVISVRRFVLRRDRSTQEAAA